MTLLEPPIPRTDQTPSILEQTPWDAGFFNFGKAEHRQTDYFNCGLVQRPDGLWLITRRSVWTDGLKFGMNDEVAFKLGGEDGLTPQIGYKLKYAVRERREQFEDARAVYHDGKTWVSCCTFIWYLNKKWTGAHQTLCTFNDKWEQITRYDHDYGKNGKGLGLNTGMEKNWLYFFHEGKLNMVYSANPHTVVEFDGPRFVTQRRTEATLPWSHGEIRGGTPPILVNGEYFTFFHSSLPWTSRYRRYFAGAYAFDAKPPFAITRITSKPLLTGSQNDPWVDRKPLVVFPVGFIMQGQNCLVTLGVNDLKSAWISIPFKDLTKRMTWVKR